MSATDDTYRDRYQCPDWCIRGDHHDGDEPPEHYGPTFGEDDVEVSVSGLTGWLRARIWLDGESLDMPTLGSARARELAQRLIEAADWMEANQR